MWEKFGLWDNVKYVRDFKQENDMPQSKFQKSFQLLCSEYFRGPERAAHGGRWISLSDGKMTVLQTRRVATRENIQIENIQEAEWAKAGSTWRGREKV